MKAIIPPHIIDTINTLLAPYGESFYPGVSSSGKGFVNWEGAAKYTGLSKSTLRRMVNLGRLRAPKKIGSGKNGATLFSYDQLDEFLAS
jgi:excisionase family DNA binding protein